MTDTKKVDPFDVEALERAVNDSATRVSAIWISFLVFALYLLVAATTVTQRQLLLAEPVKLPVLNIDLPLWGFFFLAPILFVILHVYVLLQVLLLGRTTAAYNSAVARTDLSPEENASLRQRLANTLFAQIFAGSVREREGFIGALLRAIVWITLAIGPILILLAFQFSFLAYHSHIATWTHRLLILVELAAFFLIWPLALDAHKDFQWPKVGADLKRLFSMSLQVFRPEEKQQGGWLWSRERVASLSACIAFVLVSLSVGTFPGEPHINLFTATSLASVSCKPSFLQQLGSSRIRIDLRFDRLILARVDVVDDSKLAQIARQTSERGQRPSEGERMQIFRDRDFNCSDFSFADFRRVDLTGAHLIGATLDSIALDGALLESAQMRNASLERASLQVTSLDRADLQGASMSQAHLQGASLAHAKLNGANLTFAELYGASLTDARLWGASLDAAKLKGAVLKGAQFQGASIEGGQLEGASFKGAMLQGVSFSKSVMTYADLSDAYVWRARKDPGCTDFYSSGIDRSKIIHFKDFSNKDNPIPATVESIEKFIDQSVQDIGKGSFRDGVMKQMRNRLIGTVDDNYDAAAYVDEDWQDCATPSKNNPKDEFDNGLVAILRHLVCETSDSRDAIASGVIANLISSFPPRRKFLCQMAEGLLGEDGEECGATKGIDEITKNRLREFEQASKTCADLPPQSPPAK